MIVHPFFAPLKCGSYDFVLVDFPWPWMVWSQKGAKKSPSAHYDTMDWPQIEATHPERLLRPGGVLMAYATWPLIGRQHLMFENVFGLTVKTGGAWSKRTRSGKLRVGPGKILRSVCEPFLIACRKNHKLKARGVSRAYNLIEALDSAELEGLAREHSRKPDEVYALIESLTSGWRRADLFARESRDGWDTWGKEKTKFDKRK